MNRGELRTAALANLMIPTNESQLVSIINQELNAAVNAYLQIVISNYKNKLAGFEEIGNFVPALIAQDTIVTTSGTSDYALNSDVREVLSVLLNGKKVGLIDITEDYLELYRPADFPVNEWVTARRYGEKLILSPTQEDGLVIDYRYIKEPTEMTADGNIPEVPPEHQYRLYNYACYMAAKIGVQPISGLAPEYFMDLFNSGIRIEPDESE